MIASSVEFRVLIDRYESDPRNCSRLLRALAQADSKSFLEHSVTALLEYTPSRAMQLVASLALQSGLILYLLELHAVSREQAVNLVGKAAACQPETEAALWSVLQNHKSASEEIFFAGIDLLESLSRDGRMIPRVLKLVREHPSPKIRAKAAQFVGRRTQNLSWVVSRSDQEDNNRVRAAMMESIYGMDNNAVRLSFLNGIRDRNNRVAGNAALGLYRLKDPLAISILHEMKDHVDPNFRNTFAWAMGQTMNLRFLPALTGMLQDSDEAVRRRAAKSIEELQKVADAYAAEPPFCVDVLNFDAAEGSKANVAVRTVDGQPVRGISPTAFVIHTGTPLREVLNYSVEEHDCKVGLSLGFVGCLPFSNVESMDAALSQAIASCARFRRDKDRWLVMKVAPSKDVESAGTPREGSSSTERRGRYTIFDANELAKPMQPVTPVSVASPAPLNYSTASDRIDAMLKARPLRLSGKPGDRTLQTASEALLPAGGSWTNPHLIFLGTSSTQYFLQDVLATGKRPAATIHVIAQAAEWRTPEAKRIAEWTGGIYREVDQIEQIQQICQDLCAFFLHHYRVRPQGGIEGGIQVDVYAESGRGSSSAIR